MLLRLVCRPRVSGCACPYTATAVDPEVSSFCPCSRKILCKVENSRLKSFSPSAVRLSGHSLWLPLKCQLTLRHSFAENLPFLLVASERFFPVFLHFEDCNVMYLGMDLLLF